MKRTVVTFFPAVALLILLVAVVHGDGDTDLVCSGGDRTTLWPYPYPEYYSAKVKFIYVSFVNPETLYTDTHKETVEILKVYFDEHSHGHFRFGEGSEVLLKPDGAFGHPDSIPTSWVAQLPAGDYQWDPPPGQGEYDFGHLDSLWANPVQGSATVLFAEILHKIEVAWGDVDPGLFDNTDALSFIFLGNDTPYEEGVGGRPRISVNADSLSAFFAGIERDRVVPIYLAGTGQVYGHAEGDNTFLPEFTARFIAHEWGHKLGSGDGPPPFNGWNESRYYYGTRNLLWQHYYIDEPIPPVALGWLQHYPWSGDGDPLVVDFTDSNHYNLKLYDIRQPEGKIYKFRLDEQFYSDDHPALPDQHFLFAYHAGTGLDARQNAAGDSVERAKGLEIWHCIGHNMFDLESAWGLYTDVSDTAFLADTLDYWSQPDTETGYDNHDWWNPEGGPQRGKFEYRDYIGDPFDFFSINLPDTVAYKEKDEFAYWTNPSCLWYASSGGAVHRRYPQIRGNSLIMRIIEEYADADPPYIEVDFLSAPDGVVESPQDGAVFAPGDTLVVEWTTDYGDVIDAIDVLFSPVGGDIGGYEFWQTVDTNVPVSEGDSTYAWVVADSMATSAGKITVVFHNSLSYHTNAAESPGLFTIDGNDSPIEFIVGPEDGDEYYAGEAMTIAWTDALLVNFDAVDLFFRPAAAASWELQSHDGYQAEAGIGWSLVWTPGPGQITGTGEVKLRLRLNQAFVGEAVGEGSFTIFPDAVRLIDETVAVRLDDQYGYTGRPYSAVTLDFNKDDKLDLLVTLEESDQGPYSPLFWNDGLPGELPLFADRTTDEFPADTEPPVGATCAVLGDFDNDGHEDLFVGHEDDPRLYSRNDSLGRYDDVTGLSEYVHATALPWLDHTRCAAWVDFDHDGDVDLHLGRAEDDIAALADAVLLNQGPDSTSRFAYTTIGLSGQSNPLATHTVSWCDYDNDQMWEVFVGGSGGPDDNQGRLYNQVSDTLFVDESASHSALSDLSGVRSSQWIDVDNDGDFDLLIASAELNARIISNRNGLFLGTEDIPGTDHVDRALGLDYDHDGWQDVLLVSSDETAGGIRPEMLANLRGYPGMTDRFLRVSERLGFASQLVGPFGGAVAADFNNDGDLDLFLGRTSSPGRFFQSVRPDSTDAPSAHWLGVEVIAGPDSNSSPIGAVVQVLRDGASVGLQQIVGGSGRGGQLPRVPIFGLGYSDAPVELLVRWPGGGETTVIVTDLDQTVTITEPGNELNILSELVSFAMESWPEGYSDWIFRWETDAWAGASNDTVTVTHASGYSCAFTDYVVLTGDMEDVQVSVNYKYDSGTQTVTYAHELRWNYQTCHKGCTYTYEIVSSNGNVVAAHDAIQGISNKVCPKSF